MTSEHELMIDGLLWDQAPSDMKDGSDPNSVRLLVVAWYLGVLSSGTGLSDEYGTAPATMPSDAASFLSHYFTDLHDVEHLRDDLYAALVAVVFAPGTSDVADDLLAKAQVFWALSHEKERRPALPFTRGHYFDLTEADGSTSRQQAWIGTEGFEGDFALLKRTARADGAKGILKPSGSGLRRQGWALAVRIARHLVETTLGEVPSLGGAYLHMEEKTQAIRWPRTPSPRPQNPTTVQTTLGGDRARAVQQTLDRLRFLAEALPHEGTGALATALLAAGIESGRSGRYDLAMSQFAETASISEALGVAHPDQPEHAVRLVIALLMDGSVRLLAGAPADDVVRRAGSLSQDLVDGDDNHADLQILGLTLQGLLEMLGGELDAARKSTARAVTIATKVARHNNGADVLVATNLVTLAGIDVSADLAQEALTSISQALTLTGRMFEAAPEEVELRILHGGALHVSAAVYDSLERPEDALAAAASASGVIYELAAGNERMLFMLANSQVLAGRNCVSLKRYDEAVEWFSRAILSFEQLGPSPDGLGDTVSAHALSHFIRGALLAQSGQREDAEASLLRVVGLLDGRTAPDERHTTGQAFMMLSQLYRASDRADLAAHAERRAAGAMEG